ncbi:ankyrin repeat domain-containing protein [Streptomyces sp. NPDC127172]|uniref:ankyrin repeat domain-containing protein n=1 Tax=Streptomyces sp. NPDC127172 TaxID=3345382 RepID=UPI003629B793
MTSFEIENPWTLAHQAVESSEHATLTRLLDEGADVNEVCCGMTLLMHAIELEGDSALQSGQPGDSALTAILLAYGADPAAEIDGRTAHGLAHFYDHGMAIRLLGRFTARQDRTAEPDTEGLSAPASLDDRPNRSCR